jgi:hypothetical protein
VQWLLPAEAGFLEAEGVERTQNFRQEAILPHLDLTSQKKIFDLRLPGGHSCSFQGSSFEIGAYNIGCLFFGWVMSGIFVWTR